MSFEFYAQRLLNPFRGSVHILRYQFAEAITMDGVRGFSHLADTVLTVIASSRR